MNIYLYIYIYTDVNIWIVCGQRLPCYRSKTVTYHDIRSCKVQRSHKNTEHILYCVVVNYYVNLVYVFMSLVSRSLTKYTQTQQQKHSLWALVLASLGIFKTGKAQNKAFPLCNSIGLSISRNTGWWYTYPSEKYDFVSWDDEIPNIYGKS